MKIEEQQIAPEIETVPLKIEVDHYTPAFVI